MTEHAIESKTIADAKGITWTTLLGIRIGEYPVVSGNCFSVHLDGARDLVTTKDYRIVNFSLENLNELLRREAVSWPVKIRILDEERRVAVIHDPRIPDKWYDRCWCGVCCPRDLLPPQQRLEQLLDINRGTRSEGDSIVSISTGPGHRSWFRLKPHKPEECFYHFELKHDEAYDLWYWCSGGPGTEAEFKEKFGDFRSHPTGHVGIWIIKEKNYLAKSSDVKGVFKRIESVLGGHTKSIDQDWPTMHKRFYETMFGDYEAWLDGQGYGLPSGSEGSE